jgi:hypothetical protein
MQPKLGHLAPGFTTISNFLTRTSYQVWAATALLALLASSLLYWPPGAIVRAFQTPESTQPTIGPGIPRVGSNAPRSAASSTKAGSVLFFHRYTSSSARPAGVNTLLQIVNTNPRDSVTVRIFFVSDCRVSDQFFSLAPNQSKTLLMSKEQPDATGYAIAMAVNSQGLPTQFNWLIGSASIRTSTGHEANYNAVAVAKRSAGAVRQGESQNTVNMVFNDVDFDRLPKVVAVDNIQNQDPTSGPAVLTEVTLYSPPTDLSVGFSDAITVNAIAYDSVGKPYPTTVNASCQLATRVANIWRSPSISNIIRVNNPGWATFAATREGRAVPVLGLSLSEGTDRPLHDGRTMQALSWLDTYTITVPVKVPDSVVPDVITQNQPEAPGHSAGASDMKAGSVLIYPRFVGGQYGDTRVSVTNTHPSQKVRVRIYFTSVAATLQTTSGIVTLLPNQTVTFLAQDIAPDQRGLVMLAAVDSRALQIQFNYLIGSAQVWEASGHTTSFNAIAFAKNSPGTLVRNPDQTTADMLFDDLNYDRFPAVLALSAVPSQVDNSTLIGYLRPDENNFGDPNPRAVGVAVLHDESLMAYSATMGTTEAELGNVRPSPLSPPITSTLAPGQRGWMTLRSLSPFFGWANNRSRTPFTASADGNWQGGFDGGNSLHILSSIDSFKLTAEATNPNNQQPTAVAANIGLYVEARRASGTIVRLDASESSDPDPDDELSYRWYVNEQLVSTARVGDLLLPIGIHYIRLIVIDGSDAPSLPDEQIVEVRDTTPPQISGVPSDISKIVGTSSGVAITYPMPVAYDMVDGPLSVTASKPSGSIFPIGRTTVTFTARDRAGNVATAKMIVTVSRGFTSMPPTGGVPGSIAPTMDNINDQYVPLNTVRNLRLQAKDADGDTVTFKLLNAPSFARLINLDPGLRSVTLQIAPREGDRVASVNVQVMVTDSRGASFTTLPFRIFISDVPNDETGSGGGIEDGGGGGGGDGGGTPPANQPPTAVAKPLPETVRATSKQGAEVHLDGSASNDPDGDPLTYSWSENGRVIAEGAIVDVVLPVGKHSIVLTVTDDKGASHSAAPVTIEVLPRPLSVSSVTPAKFTQSGTTTITITGTGFNSNTQVKFECGLLTSCAGGTGITVQKYVSVEEDRLVVTISSTSSSGNRTLVVTNPNGETAKLVNCCAISR